MGLSAPMSVIAVVMISSPGSGSIAATAAWIAAVPDEHAYANLAPTDSAKLLSSSLTKVPFVGVNVPLCRAAETSSTSS